MRRVLLLATLLLVAGCLGQAPPDENAPPTGEQDAGGDQEDTRRVTRALIFKADVDGPQVADGRLDISWPSHLGEGLITLDVHLAWDEGANRFGLETERPDGSVHTVEANPVPGSTTAQGDITQLAPGDYVFYPTAQGPVLADELTLTVTVTWILPVQTQPNVDGGMTQGRVTTQALDDGRWRATVTYVANGTASDRMDLTVRTVNGGISLDGNSDRQAPNGSPGAWAVMTVFATESTEEAAKERALGIEVTLVVGQGTLEATAQAPSGSQGSEDWERRGASASLGVPASTTLSGTAETTNGGFQLDEVRFDGLILDTTNGGFEGSLVGQGELGMDTTNGEIDVYFTPTGSANILADSTNGGMTLGLTEASDIAYEIDAETTNGELSEDMAEATLVGDDEAATLRTQGGSGRAIQVTGTLDTTNGSIHFDGR